MTSSNRTLASDPLSALFLTYIPSLDSSDSPSPVYLPSWARELALARSRRASCAAFTFSGRPPQVFRQETCHGLGAWFMALRFSVASTSDCPACHDAGDGRGDPAVEELEGVVGDLLGGGPVLALCSRGRRRPPPTPSGPPRRSSRSRARRRGGSPAPRSVPARCPVRRITSRRCSISQRGRRRRPSSARQRGLGAEGPFGMLTTVRLVTFAGESSEQTRKRTD
ncbi:unnamed protein product [Spirodela intermedia]|uniref:Uncharacterized protein n=1 Tax=Spirodela intermedia TaxID=51605 RepID=A0A7I8JU11_SPIIN|nr:unnamed protein product [Spirodela intermedia]CAA6673670.1 unnamed protein product [Spirodela intermedia]